MALEPTPFALASWLNSRFQASKPPGPLPHCAAFASALENATHAIPMIAAKISLPAVIQNSLDPIVHASAVDHLLGELATSLSRAERRSLSHTQIQGCDTAAGLHRQIKGLYEALAPKYEFAG